MRCSDGNRPAQTFIDAILHRTAHFDYDAPSDEELIAAARDVFAMLGREEEDDAVSAVRGDGRSRDFRFACIRLTD